MRRRLASIWRHIILKSATVRSTAVFLTETVENRSQLKLSSERNWPPIRNSLLTKEILHKDIFKKTKTVVVFCEHIHTKGNTKGCFLFVFGWRKMMSGERLGLEEEWRTNCSYVVENEWWLPVKINYGFGFNISTLKCIMVAHKSEGGKWNKTVLRSLHFLEKEKKNH